jgi:hypothetical protein
VPPVAETAPETSNPGFIGIDESAAPQPGVRQGGR